MNELDARYTFDTFVVGPANRLASAAARRAADSPGTSYNPLFIYSASGLGKSHILTAIANHVRRLQPDRKCRYQSAEGYLEELTRSLGEGSSDRLRDQYGDIDILLLDDVQFLTGQTQAQEMMLRTLDALTSAEKQIVLASDRPPAEINGLDARLVSRFSGGLIVDIGPPEYETRVAIMRKKAEEMGGELEPGVAELIARYPFKNVRELQGGLNRVLAIQELEGRTITKGDVERLLGARSGDGSSQASKDEFGAFVEDISQSMAASIEVREAPWRRLLREAAEAAEADGISAGRVRRLIDGDVAPVDVEEIVESFRLDVERLKGIRDELERVGNPWHEAAEAVLNDPERLEEAESLLASARERVRAFSPVPEGPALRQLPPTLSPLAVRSAERLVLADRPDYNPLFITCRNGDAGLAILRAAGRTFQAARADGVVGLISASDFAEDFIRALSAGVAGAWRERWWTVELLLMYGAEALSETERAQDEVFHLFETLKRRGARIFIAADRPPAEIEGIDERLRSRFEGGLVLDVESTADLEELERPPRQQARRQRKGAEEPAGVIPPLDELDFGVDGRGGLFMEGGLQEGLVDVRAGRGATTSEPRDGLVGPGEPLIDIDSIPSVPGPDASEPLDVRMAPHEASEDPEHWYPSSEKAIWTWPRLAERLIEDRD